MLFLRAQYSEMENIIIKLYQVLPKKLVRKIGASDLLKPIRNFFLRDSKNHYRETFVLVNRNYNNYNVRFKFYASIKIAEKAQNRGIENSLLRSSIELLKSKGITENAVILDIGANFGYLTTVWAQTISSPNGKVLSFEPQPYLYSSLKKTVESNDLTEIISLNKLAVGKEEGTITLNFAGTSSNLLQSDHLNEQIVTKVTTIDNFLKESAIYKCDLIKIDVDGLEYDILMGAKDSLKKYKPLLIVETNNNKQIINFCSELEYKIYDMNLDEYHEGDKLPQNIFCI